MKHSGTLDAVLEQLKRSKCVYPEGREAAPSPEANSVNLTPQCTEYIHYSFRRIFHLKLNGCRDVSLLRAIYCDRIVLVL